MKRSLVLMLGAVAVLTGLTGPVKPHAAVAHADCEFLKTRHLAVQVMIDGKGPFRMIFDTGSPAMLLTNRVGKECNLFDSKRPKSKAVRAAGQVNLQSVEIGGAKAVDVPAVVIDHPTLKAIEGLTGQIDGIVGYPFFGQFVTTVDYSTLKVSFVPNGHKPGDATEAVMKAMFSRGQKPPPVGASGQWGLEVAKEADDAKPGIDVTKVYAGSAAAAAGLRPGDRLLIIGGRWTDTEIDAILAASAAPANQAVTIRIRRDGRDSTLEVTPRPGF